MWGVKLHWENEWCQLYMYIPYYVCLNQLTLTFQGNQVKSCTEKCSVAQLILRQSESMSGYFLLFINLYSYVDSCSYSDSLMQVCIVSYDT